MIIWKPVRKHGEMAPFLIEGLDCSGKKATAEILVTMMATLGVTSRAIIGPMSSSPLRTWDRLLTDHHAPHRRGSAFDRIRRFSYVVEPSVDRIFYRPRAGSLDIKVSSHYRSWARARIEGDSAMSAAYTRLRLLQPRFEGAILLTVPFAERIERHRRDVANGTTEKIEEFRFMNSNQSFFEMWDYDLLRLLGREVRNVSTIDTASHSAEDVAKIALRQVRKIYGF